MDRSAKKSLLLLVMTAIVGCDSVVPADSEFASNQPSIGSRCTQTAGAKTSEDAYEIGVIIPLTKADGTADTRGKFRSQAMTLAVTEINQRQGVGGKPFRLRFCDTQADWSSGGEAVAKQLATWLIDTQQVSAVLAGGSSDTLAVQAVTVPAGRLLMGVTATSTDLTSLADNGLVWRVAPSDVYQGVVLARMVSETVAEGGLIAKNSVALLAEASPYGDGLAKVVQGQLGNAVQVFTVTAGASVDNAVQAAADLQPKAVIVVASAPLAAQIVNARAKLPALAASQLFFSDTAHNTDFLNALATGVSVQGARGTIAAAPGSITYDNFVNRYKSLFGADPTQSSYTAHAYDAVYCVALAHAWALRTGGAGKVDGVALADGLKHLTGGQKFSFDPSDITSMVAALLQGKDLNIDGASGALDFNPVTGEAPAPVQAWTLDAQGKFVALGVWTLQDQGDGQYLLDFSKL